MESKFNLSHDEWTQIAEDFTENIDFSQRFPSKNITFASLRVFRRGNLATS